jgi:hypothetical protein
MNFSQFIHKRRLLLCVALLGIVLGGFGCGTEDEANTSVKPWNSPEGFQNSGIPSMMQSH